MTTTTQMPTTLASCISDTTGCLVLNQTAMQIMQKGTTIADWMDASEKSKKIFPTSPQDKESEWGEPSSEVVIALQPVARHSPGTDPSDAKNWFVDATEVGELLARTRKGGNAFPFSFSGHSLTCKRQTYVIITNVFPKDESHDTNDS